MSFGAEDLPGWSLSKRYAAALFYLSHVHSTPINEAQWGRLNALQMLIAYGKYSEGLHPAEFLLCSPQERKKREEDWKSISHLPKSLAIQQFLDIMNNLFPIWWRTRAVLDDFDGEWGSLATFSAQESITSTTFERSQEKRRAGVRRHISQKTKKEYKSGLLLPTALDKIEAYEYQRMTSSLPKLPKLNAIQDAASTISRLKGGEMTQDSRYYQTKRHRENKDAEEVPRQVLTGLYETLSSGKSTTKRESEFFKSLVSGISDKEGIFQSLVHQLESSRHLPHLPEVAKYPEMTAASLESLLKPRLTLPIRLFEVLEPLLTSEAAELPSLFPVFLSDLSQAISILFGYINSLERHTVELERRVENLEFDYDTTIVTLEAMMQLYSLKNRKSIQWALSNVEKTQFQLEVSRGMSILKGEHAERFRKCEEEMAETIQMLEKMEKELAEVVMDRDKIRDHNRLIEMSVYYGIESTFKGKTSPGLLQTLDKKPEISEFAGKEIDKLRKEISEMRQENELLHRKMQGARRGSVMDVAEE